MTRSENGRGDPPPLTALGEKPDRDQTLRRIEAATDHLGRLQQIMLEMLRSDSPAAPAPAPAPPISPNLPLNLPVMSLSRQMLDQLALALGDPPLRDRAGLPQRGLRLVAGRDMPAGSGPAPLWLRIDRHLRLRLDPASNQVAIERLVGMHWQPLPLCGHKDGQGGITLAPAALIGLAGPLSPWLARLLQPGPAPDATPSATLPPCPEEG